MSDLHLSRQELEQKIAEADALAEMKSNLLATISHEIRTPMQTIYGILELIDDEHEKTKIDEMVHTAQAAASGLLEILDDVLDMAKMDADKMELDAFEVPVRLLVRGMLEALVVKVHGVSIDLIDDIEQDVPFVVIGDPKRLRQILMNLCGNALKFTHAGNVTVRVSTKVEHISVPAGGVGLRFEVIDTGIGMSEEVCNKLFQSFAQADNSTQRKYGGTGLGLSISKKLVELMNGAIGVSSKAGEGSNFWFEIPTIEVNDENSAVDLPNLEGISVLSVEDHPNGAKEIMSSLKSMGATVEQCGTYKEGLDLIKARPFDVAVIDQGLPDGLGIDLIKEVIKTRPDTGLVMYTVRDDIGLSHSLRALGATYLTKPASRLGLGEAVLDATDRVEYHEISGPKRLLIAEDTASVRDILQRQLDKIGVDADFVENGKDALQALNTGLYGILITDLHMPELDGYGVIEHIRKKEALDNSTRFPIVVLTADVHMSERDTYMKHGFDECLLKPVSLGQFQRLLMRWGLIGESVENNAPMGTDQDDSEEGDRDDSQTDGGAASAIDRDAMIAQMGAFDEIAIDMLGMFIEMTAPLISDIRSAHDADDMNAVIEVAHSLKGSARSACCNVLGDIAAAIQEDGENGAYDATLIDDIAGEFERVKQAVAALS